MTQAKNTPSPRKSKYYCDVCDLNIQSKNIENITCSIPGCSLSKVPTEKEKLKKELEEVKAEYERLQQRVTTKTTQATEKP